MHLYMLQFMRQLMFFVKGVVLTSLTMNMWKIKAYLNSLKLLFSAKYLL